MNYDYYTTGTLMSIIKSTEVISNLLTRLHFSERFFDTNTFLPGLGPENWYKKLTKKQTNNNKTKQQHNK